MDLRGFIGRNAAAFAGLVLVLSPAAAGRAEPPQLPPGYPAGQYDEAKVPAYVLPDPLVLQDGNPVRTVRAWTRLRRPEILRRFETEVYGRTPVGRPHGMHWKVVSVDRKALGRTAVTSTVTLWFTRDKDGPKMDLKITLPRGKWRVPVFLAPAWSHNAEAPLKRGYGLVTFDPNQVMPDKKDQPYLGSLRQRLAPVGQAAPRPDDWGALGVWAWAASRAMDYLQTDPDVDAKKVAIMGVSRYGKAAIWAGAQDERFAMVISVEAGCGGQTIVRRGVGETVRAINTTFPYWFDDNFKAYDDRVSDLPVDWHELIALVAPRPVYVSAAEQDLWGDPHGSFLAAKAAEPVYALYGEKGLGVEDEPPVSTPVGGFIGWHKRTGGHGMNDYDWQRFLDFADRHWGAPAWG